MSVQRKGLLLALATAAISGLAVFINGYGVRVWSEDPTTYTTFKNLVAAVFLIGALGIAKGETDRPASRAPLPPCGRKPFRAAESPVPR